MPAEHQDLDKAAVGIGLGGCHAMYGESLGTGKRHGERNQNQPSAGDSDHQSVKAKRRNQEEPADGVERENVAVPNQQQVDEADEEQDDEAAQQEAGGAGVERDTLDLNRHADTKQEREKCEGFEFDKRGDECGNQTPGRFA